MASILIQDQYRIPQDRGDLESFRRWAHSDSFPDTGNIAYLCGEIWLDFSMEHIFTHNLVKTNIYSTLHQIATNEEFGGARVFLL